MAMILVIVSTIVSAFALSFEYHGSGSGQHGGSASSQSASSAFVIPYASSGPWRDIVGYRFSVVDANGNPKGDNNLDVYNNAWFANGYGSYSSVYAAMDQKSKKQWHGDGNINTDYTVNELVSLTGFNYMPSSNIDSSLSQDTSQLNSWLTKNDNHNAKKIFKECGVDENQIQNDDRLIIEPLLQCKLDHKPTVLTPTELAVFGSCYYGLDRSSSSKNSNEFAFLNNYVNKEFPNLLRTSEWQKNLWDGGPLLSQKTSYRNVINKGYGVAVLSARNIKKEYTVTFSGNGGSYIFNGQIYSGINSFTVEEGTQITLPRATRDYWNFHCWYVNPSVSDPSMGYPCFANNTYTVTGNVAFQANYNPVQVRYNVNGGNSSFNVDGNGNILNNSGTPYVWSWGYDWGGPNRWTQYYSEPHNAFYQQSYFGLSRPGYRFVGWNPSPSEYYSDTTYSSDCSVSVADIATTSQIINDGYTTLYAVWAPINVTYNVNLQSTAGYESTDFETPVNYFTAKESGTSENASYTHNRTRSSVTLNGSARCVLFDASDGTIQKGDKLNVTLVYKKGSYSGSQPYFVTEPLFTGGSNVYNDVYRNGIYVHEYFGRNNADLEMPSANNPITSTTLTVGENRTSLLTWIWSASAVNYSNYEVEIYVTKNVSVQDLALKNYVSQNNQGELTDAYETAKTGKTANYISLPAAQNYSNTYNTPQQSTHPFAYHLSLWNSSADGNGSITASLGQTSTAINSSQSHTLYAQYKTNEFNVKYNTNDAEAVAGNGFTVDKTTSMLQKDGKDYIEHYTSYKDVVTLKNDDDFQLSLLGHTFLNSWHYEKKENVYEENSQHTIESILKRDIDINDATIIFRANWREHTYDVEYWADLGENDCFKPFITSHYQNIETDKWLLNSAENTPYFVSHNFYQVLAPERHENVGFRQDLNLLENKFEHKLLRFNGWGIYSEAKGKYRTMDQDGNLYWETFEEMVNNHHVYYLVKNLATTQRLSDVDRDTVRLFLTFPPNKPIPGIDESEDVTPWISIRYNVKYCGHSADGYNPEAKNNIFHKEDIICETTKQSEFIYDTEKPWNVDVYNAIEYSKGNDYSIEYRELSHAFSNTLSPNEFLKTGYHFNYDITWFATAMGPNGDRIYGTKDGKYGWYPSSDKAVKVRYFSNEEADLVNLILEDNATIYMHSIWHPNTYSVYYCGNGSDANTYKDEENVKPGRLCPNKAVCTNDYLDPKVWTYDGDDNALAPNEFTRTGYDYIGWRAYDVYTDKWFGYSKSNSHIPGWYSKKDIKKFYIFDRTYPKKDAPTGSDKKQADINNDLKYTKNLTAVNNGVVYMVAQWVPIPYTITYDENIPKEYTNNNKKMANGAHEYSEIGLMNKIKNPNYYDTEYVLQKNSYKFTCMDKPSNQRRFDHWELSREIPVNGDYNNRKTYWMAMVDGVPQWMPETDVMNPDTPLACQSYDAFEEGFLGSYKAGTIFKNVTPIRNDVVTAHAKWMDDVSVKFNINLGDSEDKVILNKEYSTDTNGFITVYKNSIDSLLFGNKIYEQVDSSDNLDTRSGMGLNKIVHINNPNDFGLVRDGYEFVGWNISPDGDKDYIGWKNDDNSNTLKSLDTTMRQLRAVSDNSEDIGPASVTLYAQWRPVVYKINYCGNGATGETYTDYINALKATGVTKLPTFQKAPFEGVGCKHNAVDVCDSVGNFYSANEINYNDYVLLEPNRFTLPGYAFLGWSKVPNPDKNDTLYSDGDGVFRLTNKSEPVFLYAQWAPLNISYNANGAAINPENKSKYVLDSTDYVTSVANYSRVLTNCLNEKIRIEEAVSNKATDSFALEKEGCYFVGWGLTPDSKENLLVPGEYTQAQILKYLIDNNKYPVGTSEVPLYAIWAKRNVSFTYNYTNNDCMPAIMNPPFLLNDTFDVCYNDLTSIYKDFYYNPTIDSEAAVSSVERFSASTGLPFAGWVAHKKVNNVDFYLTNSNTGLQWKEFVGQTDDAYLFKGNERIGKNQSVSMQDLLGEQIDADTNEIQFKALWIQKPDKQIVIHYNVGENDVVFPQDSTYQKDATGDIVLSSGNHLETVLCVKEFTNESKANATFYLPRVGNNHLNMHKDYYHFDTWAKLSDMQMPISVKDLDALCAQNSPFVTKSETETKLVYTIKATWLENTVTVQYNGASAESVNNLAYSLKEGFVYKGDELFTNKFLATDNNAVLTHPSEFEFHKSHYTVDTRIWTLDSKDIDSGKTYTAKELGGNALKYSDVTVTLFAKFNPIVLKIKYNANGGYLDSSSQFNLDTKTTDMISINGNHYVQQTSYDKDVRINTPEYFSLSKDSYSFKGWNLDKLGQGKMFTADEVYKMYNEIAALGMPLSHEITLYAQWEPSTYRIYYCGNGADKENYTNYLTKLPESQKFEWTFQKAPFSNSSCNENGSGCNSIGNFYDLRNWEYNKDATIMANFFERNGYISAGYWKDGYGNTYPDLTPDNATTINPPVDENGVLFLYAQWQPIEYTVVYEGNHETDGIMADQDNVKYNEVIQLNHNGFTKDYHHTNNDNCWYATRVIDGQTCYCVGYNEQKDAFDWKVLSEDISNTINVPKNAYIFKDAEQVKNLTNKDGDIVTMHAIWTPNTLKISYNVNGGTLSQDSTYAINNEEFILKDKTENASIYQQEYVYDENKAQIALNDDLFFNMYCNSTESENGLTVFTGWSYEKGSINVDFSKNKLNDINVYDIAPSLKDEDVEIQLFAAWNKAPKFVLTYYEGENVSKEKFEADVNTISPYPDDIIRFESAESTFAYPVSKIGTIPTYNGTPWTKTNTDGNSFMLQPRGNYDESGLYTYYNNMEKDEAIKVASNLVSPTNRHPEIPFCINILYNNPPTITAYDRWYTIEDALAGKITKEDLLKTAFADDKESLDINEYIDIKDFNNLKFDKPGDYKVTYAVTDNIPANGYHKSAETTVTVHIVHEYGNQKVRFISDKYYPLMTDLYTDENGNFKAEKINGKLYFVPATSTMSENEYRYPVDAGLSVKKLINADGTYTIIPLSKWYKQESCANALRECLSNKKDSDGNWSHIEESWSFTNEEIKAIRKNIKDNVYDNDFYANHFINGRCVSFSNKSKIAQTVFSQDDAKYLAVTGSDISGFKNEQAAKEWSLSSFGSLNIPATLNNIEMTGFSSNAFVDNKEITMMKIPSTIKELDVNVFSGCSNLKNIYFDNSKENITLKNVPGNNSINFVYRQK